MRRLLGSLTGADPKNPHPTDPQRDEDEKHDEQDANTWDDGALEKMSGRGWQGTHVISAFGALGGPPAAFARGGGPRMLMSKCAMAPRAAPMPMMAAPMACAAAAPAPGGAIGFKAGGAEDVSNFRENIDARHLPLPTDVTYEGLIKDYFFDTASEGAEPPTELFAPSYSLALAPDPLAAAAAAGGNGASPCPAPGGADGRDVFLAVGLDSGLADWRRPRLNLAILLDVSGSMDARFDQYYYGAPGGRTGREADRGGAPQNKLEVAKQVLKAMLQQLRSDDSVSISLFSDSAASPKRMGRWGAADAAGIGAGIDQLRTISGTNFQAGFDEAQAQLRRWPDAVDGDPSEVENRIIVLTDAQPNAGDFSEGGLAARMKAAAADWVHMTVVGVGLDFNSELVESISKVKGGNYLSVHSPDEAKKRLAAEFDYIVAPLVYGLELRVDPASLAPPASSAEQGASSARTGAGAAAVGDDPEWQLLEGAGGEQQQVQEAQVQAQQAQQQGQQAQPAGWRIEAVYGSPEAEERRLTGDGSIMRINSLFPSPKTEEGIKGGVVLLRLRPPQGCTPASAPPLRLEARYADRSGQRYTALLTVAMPAEGAAAADDDDPLYQSSGVRKAVALARLTDALQSWLADEWAGAARPPADDPNRWDASQVAGAAGIQPQPFRPAPNAPAPLPFATPPGGPRRLRPGCPLRPPCLPPPPDRTLGRWEREARPLTVNPDARAALVQLGSWLEGEVAAVGDASMQQEVALLRRLAAGGAAVAGQ
ncbi:Cell surface [Micractinium conductrix]|uniref:Cell surface n=1 Tax=Micractinium conductrix TaxID=554055 RepID=A0A2P6V037_9CHLO|nr:Cell surface [Micractinium conductrix]|eukprot:PSC67450.1 Cell surface [Micractinium conductrix]